MAEEYDPKDLPGNPRLMETFLQFIDRQKKLAKSVTYPPGTKMMCKGCGDCCTWNYYKMQVSEKLVKDLKAKARIPHGYWILGDHLMHMFLVYWDGEEDEPCRTMRFSGPIGEDYYVFHKASGRRHGYWVLNDDGWICCYSPDKCRNLMDDMKCAIYEDRPKICRGYYCGRYPLIPP